MPKLLLTEIMHKPVNYHRINSVACDDDSNVRVDYPETKKR